MVSCNSLDDRIKLASSMIEKDIVRFKQFNYLYPFTTENINGYLDYFDLKDKSLLTVGSSGDQVLNAILCGSKDITLYDICPFTAYYYYLKVASIKTLNREEYLRFFSYLNYPILLLRNIKAFDKYTFDKIDEYLSSIDEESSYFFRELFNKYNGRIIRKKLFNSDEINVRVNKEVNRFLRSDDNYNKLKNVVDKAEVRIKNGDIFKMTDDRRYDNIFLSNILAYSELKKYIEFFYQMKEYLNDDGKMMVSYLFDTDSVDTYIDDRSNRYSKKDLIDAIDVPLDFISFKGNSGLFVNDNRMTDSIITYTKVKKI